MYVLRYALPLLTTGVISTPLFSFDDNQPQLGGASLTLLGNSACPPFPDYGTLFSANITQASNETIPSQTTYASSPGTGGLPAISSSASIVASRSTTGVSDRKCTEIFRTVLANYGLPTYIFRASLFPAADRFFMFSFARNGGGLLFVAIYGRPKDSPELPSSYSILTNQAFVAGNLHNAFTFNVTQPTMVNVHINFGVHTQPFSYILELNQLDEL